jgi:hypothetical protein
VYSQAHVLGWAHTGQTPIYHLISGPFTSYSKWRDHQNRETPSGRASAEMMEGSEKGGDAHSGEHVAATSHHQITTIWKIGHLWQTHSLQS